MKTLIVSVIVVSTVTTGVLLAQTPVGQPIQSPFPNRDRNFTSLAVAHVAYTEDFAKKPGFGSSRIFYLPGQDYVTVAGRTYRFSTPELLGLENEPVAYQRAGGVQNISVDVMSKAELRSKLARRPLTSTESNAVARLRAGKDLVTQPELAGVGRTKGIRAIGALRAQGNCANCHGVKAGTLLGAFSYALTPTNLVAVNTPNTIRPTTPLPSQPRVTPSVGGTNLNFTSVPNTKKTLKGSLAGVSAH